MEKPNSSQGHKYLNDYTLNGTYVVVITNWMTLKQNWQQSIPLNKESIKSKSNSKHFFIRVIKRWVIVAFGSDINKRCHIIILSALWSIETPLSLSPFSTERNGYNHLGKLRPVWKKMNYSLDVFISFDKRSTRQ